MVERPKRMRENEPGNTEDALVYHRNRVRPRKWIVKKRDPHQHEKTPPAAQLAEPIDGMPQYGVLGINPQQRVLQTRLQPFWKPQRTFRCPAAHKLSLTIGHKLLGASRVLPSGYIGR